MYVFLFFLFFKLLNLYYEVNSSYNGNGKIVTTVDIGELQIYT